MDNIQYNTERLLTQVDYGNDMRAVFSYDQRDRISTLDVNDGETFYLDLDYTYDNNSNIAQLVNGWRDTGFDWNSDTEIYSYDGLDRLTSASCTFWFHTYSYDKVGNRTAKDSVVYTINTVNQVTSLSNNTSFIYDDNGNRTQKIKGTDTWEFFCKELLDKTAYFVIFGQEGPLGSMTGFMLTFYDAENNPLCGTVFLEDSDYRWKCEDEVFYVLLNGEWVQMPDDWKPGDSIPPYQGEEA
jgi:YD repeat-containing protein